MKLKFTFLLILILNTLLFTSCYQETDKESELKQKLIESTFRLDNPVSAHLANRCLGGYVKVDLEGYKEPIFVPVTTAHCTNRYDAEIEVRGEQLKGINFIKDTTENRILLTDEIPSIEEDEFYYRREYFRIGYSFIKIGEYIEPDETKKEGYYEPAEYIPEKNRYNYGHDFVALSTTMIEPDGTKNSLIKTVPGALPLSENPNYENEMYVIDISTEGKVNGLLKLECPHPYNYKPLNRFFERHNVLIDGNYPNNFGSFYITNKHRMGCRGSGFTAGHSGALVMDSNGNAVSVVQTANQMNTVTIEHPDHFYRLLKLYAKKVAETGETIFNNILEEEQTSHLVTLESEVT